MENVMGTFETLKKACLEAPVLAFADLNKLYLLETHKQARTGSCAIRKID